MAVDQAIEPASQIGFTVFFNGRKHMASTLTRMATFALVHGAWHGAWCWELLTPLLLEEGHDVVTMDLPIDSDSASFDDHADMVCSALVGYDDDVIAVGHSYGGMAIPLVATRRPVRHLVYLCAAIPEIGRSLHDQLGDEPYLLNPAIYAGLKLDAQSRYVWGDELARAFMYADCDKQIADSAVKRLRPQSPNANALPCSLAEFPAVPSTSVVCSDDQCIGSEWSKRAADRIRAELIEIPGSHSPLLSRPQVVADVLLRVADGN